MIVDQISHRSRALYDRIADSLRARIKTGEFTPGAMLPTEADLCRDFRVARGTARAALRVLVDEGLIEKRQGSGTFVRPNADRGKFRWRVYNDLAALDRFANATPTRFEFRGHGPLPPDLARLLGYRQKAEWSRWSATRFERRSGVPVALTEAYFPEDLREVAAEFTPMREPFFRQIERLTGTPISRVMHGLRAIKAGENQATQLDVETGAPLLHLIRQYFDAKGRLVEISSNLHPGESELHYFDLLVG